MNNQTWQICPLEEWSVQFYLQPKGTIQWITNRPFILQNKSTHILMREKGKILRSELQYFSFSYSLFLLLCVPKTKSHWRWGHIIKIKAQTFQRSTFLFHSNSNPDVQKQQLQTMRNYVLGIYGLSLKKFAIGILMKENILYILKWQLPI